MSKLYFDLETIPDQKDGALERARERVKVPGNYKNEDSIKAFRDERALETWQKTGLSGLSGEICSVAFAFDDGKVHSLTRGIDIPDEQEGTLLQAFFDAIRENDRHGQGDHPHLEWIGHNVIDFDLRFLKQRAIICGVKPGIFLPADSRHGKGTVFDTMREWSGFRGYVKQSDLQEAFEIPVDPTLELVGGELVAEFWALRRFDDIACYNQDDVRVCRDIYRRLTWH